MIDANHLCKGGSGPILVLCLAGLVSCSGGGGSGGGGLSIDLGGPPPLPGGGYDYNLTILFTNDLHDQVMPVDGRGGGLARHATLVNLLRAQAAARGIPVFVANAGDCFEGFLFYERDGGATVFRLLDLMGYDVVQVGNHDHQFGMQRLYDVVQDAFLGAAPGFRFLIGNVNPSEMYANGTGPYSGAAPFTPATVDATVIAAFENGFDDFMTGTIDFSLLDPPSGPGHLFNQASFFDAGSLRIGVFGLDTPEVLYSSIPGEGDLFPDPTGRAEYCRFYDPAVHTFASDMVTWLNDPDQNPATDDGADLIVAVTHIGLGEDVLVAENAAGATGRRIDVIVGGHSHTRINTALTVDHPGGAKTLVVQAGARGEFLGRLDLLVDPVADTAALKNCELLQVDARIPEDPAAASLIQDALDGPGGVNETFGSPFSTVIAQNEYLLPGGVPATSVLGNLAADGGLAVGNAPPHSLGLDGVVIGNFVFRSDLYEGPVTVADAHDIMPLHILDRTGMSPDSLDVIDLPGGVREALNLANFPFPAPPLMVTEVEYLLEIIYSVEELLELIGSLIGIDVGGVSQYVAGLQWSGLTFAVDSDGPILDKIDTASIFIGGVPLAGNESQDWRLGMNAVVARIALPFIQFLTQIEDPPGSGMMVPFPTYDPATNATDVILWEALRDHLESLGLVGGAAAAVGGDRPRTVGPDLAFNPADVVVAPSPSPAGSTTTVLLPVLNLGETAVTSATLELFYDPTPGDRTDDPDGLTDSITGYEWPALPPAAVGAIMGATGLTPGMALVNAPIEVPVTLPPGIYPLFPVLTGVVSADPQRPETITANNGGPLFPIYITVP